MERGKEAGKTVWSSACGGGGGMRQHIGAAPSVPRSAWLYRFERL